ncbi:MAG: putative quinol monooxygenase [Bacteroidota bacterium]
MLTIVVTFTVEAEHLPFVTSELIKLLAPTRQEAGCINYDLHQDLEDPTHFVFYENWESAEHLLAHSKSAHIEAYRVATKGMITDFKLRRMNAVNHE